MRRHACPRPVTARFEKPASSVTYLAVDDPDLLALATRVVWWKPSEETLGDPIFFLAHVMTYGTADDVAIAREHFGDGAFGAALDQAPAGVFDARSWAYWQAVRWRIPPPPLPTRLIPDRSSALS